MEINEFEQVLGVMPTEDIVEGRFVLLTPHTFDQDFGSETDLPGVKLPDTHDEAIKAKFILTWKVDNRPTPFTVTAPHQSPDWSERGGWSSTDGEGPVAVTVYLTPPGNQNCVTIPSGVSALAYTEGVFTVYSGCYIDSSNIRLVGANICIGDTATDGAAHAGKPKYHAENDLNVIAETVGYDSATGALTLRTIR
jgi:hypothetical protein